MRDYPKLLVSFLLGELGVFTIVIAFDSISKAIDPATGGHGFEQGGVEGFAFGMFVAMAVCMLHCVLFSVFLLASKKLDFLSVLSNMKISFISGLFFAIAILTIEQFNQSYLLVTFIIAPLIVLFTIIFTINFYAKSKCI